MSDHFWATYGIICFIWCCLGSALAANYLDLFVNAGIGAYNFLFVIYCLERITKIKEITGRRE